MLALADVLVDQVHALAPVLTGVAVALVELVLAAVAGVARIAVAGVAGDAVDAGAVVAGVGLAVVDVALAQGAFVAWRFWRETEENVLDCDAPRYKCVGKTTSRDRQNRSAIFERLLG